MSRTAYNSALISRLLVPLALVAALVAGCGDEVSPDAVARVGEETIQKSEFDHWLEVAARTQQASFAPGGVAETVVPTPPDFTECIQAKEEQAGAASGLQGGEGEAAPTPPAEELRRQCEQEYDLLKEQVLQFLLQAEAVEQEAEERGLTVTDEEVQAQLDDIREQSFPNDPEGQQFEQFLEASGQSEEDLSFQIRLDLLINEIREDVLAEEGEITDDEIASYYEENKEQPPIGQPEQRDVNVVVTETAADAERARQAIEDGESFADVAKEFSIDPASKNRGGKLTVQAGAEEEEFDEAVFSAKPGELVGPIETELGFYVFEVTDVEPARTPSLAESREAITDILRTEREQDALVEFQEQFEESVREKTICAEEFTIVGCSNGPAPEEAAPPGVPAPDEAPVPPAPEGGGGVPPEEQP